MGTASEVVSELCHGGRPAPTCAVAILVRIEKRRNAPIGWQPTLIILYVRYLRPGCRGRARGLRPAPHVESQPCGADP